MKSRILNIVVIVAAFIVIVLISLVIEAMKSHAPVVDRRGRVSVAFTDSSGARGMFLVARQFLDAVSWRRPLTSLEIGEKDAYGFRSSYYAPRPTVRGKTLLVARPEQPLTRDEASTLRRWVDAGGQLIMTVDKDWRIEDSPDGFLEREGVEVISGRQEDVGAAGEENPVAVQPQENSVARSADLKRAGVAVPVPEGLPLNVSLPVGSAVRMKEQPKRQIQGQPDRRVLYLTLGAGRVVVIPDGEFISNATLRGNDNPALIVQLAEADGGETLMFDEYHHGFSEKTGAITLAAQFMTTPWGWMLGTAAAAGLLYALAVRRRFGRIVNPKPVSRQTPLDLVHSRASLFRLTAARTIAIEGICLNLETELTRSLGLKVGLSGLAQPPGARCQAELQALEGLRQRSRQNGKTTLTNRDVFTAATLAGRIFEEVAIE